MVGRAAIAALQVACAAALGCVLALIVALLYRTGQDTQTGDVTFRMEPNPVPTQQMPAIPVRKPDPVSRIIQQNDMCWLPWSPGATCDEGTRTYF